MILSHELQLIFLKPVKTAGTSFEIALSKYCGENDIITPISPEDEKIRKRLGFRCAQNYRKSIANIIVERKQADVVNILKAKWPRTFWNHMSAADIKNRISEKCWNDYTKISIIRNPFDRIVSDYFYSNKNMDKPFEKWLRENPQKLVINDKSYKINGECVIDFFIRFENFEQDIRNFERLNTNIKNIFDVFQQIRAKGSYRPKRNRYSASSMFDGLADMQHLVEVLCREDLERFGYSL